MQGTEAQPITVKPVAGAKVIIDGSLTINGQYTVWQDIEMMYSGWSTRQTLIPGSTPGDLPISKTLTVNGDYTTIRRWNIHDLAGVGSNGQGAVWEDNVIGRNGWKAVGDSRPGHGHGMYPQSHGARTYIRRNIFPGCFGSNIHCYTENGHIDNITLEDNVAFNPGDLSGGGAYNIVLGGYQVAESPELRRNLTHGAVNINLGYNAQYGGATDAVLTDNIAPDGITIVNTTFAENSGNVTTPITELTVKVVPTSYGAIITIYNPDSHDAATVDVTSILATGAAYRLRYAQDYDHDIATGNVAGDGTVSIDMRAASHTVAAPIAHDAGTMTLPTFGVFVLEDI